MLLKLQGLWDDKQIHDAVLKITTGTDGSQLILESEEEKRRKNLLSRKSYGNYTPRNNYT